MTAAETYAKVGIAVSDAFVACWNTKFRYNLLRPVTYIQRLIDPALVAAADHTAVSRVHLRPLRPVRRRVRRPRRPVRRPLHVRRPHPRQPRPGTAPLRQLHRGGRGGGDLPPVRRHPLPPGHRARAATRTLHSRRRQRASVRRPTPPRLSPHYGRRDAGDRARTVRITRRAEARRRGTPARQHPAKTRDGSQCLRSASTSAPRLSVTARVDPPAGVPRPRHNPALITSTPRQAEPRYFGPYAGVITGKPSSPWTCRYERSRSCSSQGLGAAVRSSRSVRRRPGKGGRLMPHDVATCETCRCCLPPRWCGCRRGTADPRTGEGRGSRSWRGLSGAGDTT